MQYICNSESQDNSFYLFLIANYDKYRIFILSWITTHPMNSLVYKGHNTEIYMPPNTSDDRKEAIFNLMLQCADAVERQVPIGYYYNNIARLVLPEAVFGQIVTPHSTMPMKNPGYIQPGIKFAKEWARQTIGMSIDQILSTDPQNSKEGQKTNHLDMIDDLRLMTLEEMWRVFRLQNNQIADGIHLTEWFTTPPGFIRNWNYWFRVFFIQIQSQYDLRVDVK